MGGNSSFLFNIHNLRSLRQAIVRAMCKWNDTKLPPGKMNGIHFVLHSACTNFH